MRKLIADIKWIWGWAAFGFVMGGGWKGLCRK